ncbi:MAG: hypothetical protein R3C01_07600 [Planctomycetaceae bacterium]
MFYRLTTDGLREPVNLVNLYAGPTPSACWIVGGGPSLSSLPVEMIVRSVLPKFAVNLAGHGLLRPNFWTSYDPTIRFQRSTYLDASILKFVHRSRAMDLVPETTYKVCDAPGTLFFDRDPSRGFHDFLSVERSANVADAADPTQSERDREFDVPEPREREGRGRQELVADWQDSLIQAIAIAYQLGFRVIYLVGCEMFIAPNSLQQRVAIEAGVTYVPREPLRDFVQRCGEAGLSREALSRLGSPRQYHFEESKPLDSAIHTDTHYYRVAQYLRMCRRHLAGVGVSLISATPQSRLNDFFAYRSVESVCNEIRSTIGDPQQETTLGRYTTNENRLPEGSAPMRDFPPHHWKRKAKGHSQVAPVAGKKQPFAGQEIGGPSAGEFTVPIDKKEQSARLFRNAFDQLPEIPVDLEVAG